MRVVTLFCVIFLLCLLRPSISHHRLFGFPQIYIHSCRRPNCETVRCKSPQSLACDLEVGSDRCHCCPYCLKGPGKSCAGPNNQKGNCAKGFVCVDANRRPISDVRGPYTPFGECKDGLRWNHFPILPPGKKCPKTCAAVSCMKPEGCQFGIGLGRCGCCSVCLNGPGAPCAGPNNENGNCGRGLVCVDSKLSEIPKNQGPNTQSGKCERRPCEENCFPNDPLPTDNVCPTPDCSTVRCGLPENCEFGFATDDCSCCPRCNKGLEDPCAGPNNVEGNCAETLVCVDANQDTIARKRGQNTPVGKCDVPYSTGT